MSQVKIGLITTLDTNIGDDFIREGICHVVNKIFTGRYVEFVCVNKHHPYSVYPVWHPIHLRSFANNLPFNTRSIVAAFEEVFPKIGFSTFDDCDLIIQCGAPVFWPGCSDNEWVKPLWHEVIGRLYNKVPVLNLAAGSCYPWEKQSEKLDTEDSRYIKSILGYCRLTTVRDKLARKICELSGESVPLIPCSALLAANGRKSTFNESGYILINYMSGGGHYEWEQGINAKEWENTIKETIFELGKRHKVAFICHDNKEFESARIIGPGLPVYFPKNSDEYFHCVSGAKFGICNRMHASVAMAGMGVPSIAVCTDTRLLMVELLGLPVHYVKEINSDLLVDQTEAALLSLSSEKDRLHLLRSTTFENYFSEIQSAIPHR